MINEIHYDSVLDNLLTAIVILDEHLNITYMNAAAENLLGVSEEHTHGKAIQSYFLASDGTPYSIAEAWRNGQHFTKRRAIWQLLHQREITVDYTVTPDPELKHIVVEVQALDRLLRISRDEAWLASQETTNNIVRSMAHEIKNPLGGIRGAAQLLARELHEPELEEFTNIIIGETDRLRNLTDRMLGPIKLVDQQPVNVHEALEHVASVMRMEAQNTVVISKDYDPSIPELLCDKEQLIQALMNIANNAFQALSESNTVEGMITLKTRIQRRYTIGRKTYPLIAQICITDNGPGIPSEIIEDIFFPMITGRAEGTGLGLAIAQNLITRHNGLIECSSVPGRTEFAIYLPLGNTDV